MVCSLALLESISLERSEPECGGQGNWPIQEERGRQFGAEGFVLNPAQAPVSSPSTAGGYLAKNLVHLLGYPKEKDKTM